MNAPIQGGAVDIVKIAMAQLERAGFHTVHQIHDQVFVQMRAAEATPEAEHEILRIMEGCVKLSVPLRVGLEEDGTLERWT